MVILVYWMELEEDEIACQKEVEREVEMMIDDKVIEEKMDKQEEVEDEEDEE